MSISWPGWAMQRFAVEPLGPPVAAPPTLIPACPLPGRVSPGVTFNHFSAALRDAAVGRRSAECARYWTVMVTSGTAIAFAVTINEPNLGLGCCVRSMAGGDP